MERTVLGRTELEVSVAGLGCGGHSRLGQSSGQSFEQSVAVVRAAIDAGVNLIDTASAYGTEEIVGASVKTCRDQVVISSKLGIVRPGTSPLKNDFLTADEFIALAETNLKRLGTDHIDIFHLHGVMPEQYAYCRSELLPALLTLREQGKIRFLGLTERFILDTSHQMLARALEDDHWDVVMTGFNMINPSARHSVLEQTRSKGIGTLVMFAVRRALNSSENATECVLELIDKGHVDSDLPDPDNPLGFLTESGAVGSVAEAAYRFCRHEPGVDVVLTGTGSPIHLAENIRSLGGPPLPKTCLEKLDRIFGGVDCVSGN